MSFLAQAAAQLPNVLLISSFPSDSAAGLAFAAGATGAGGAIFVEGLAVLEEATPGVVLTTLALGAAAFADVAGAGGAGGAG